MKKIVLILFLFVSVTFWMAFKIDQAEEASARKKVQYIYAFTKWIDWPDNTKKGNFVIGIIGNNAPLTNQFNLLASEKVVASQKLEIKNLSSVADVSQCQIVYVLSENSAQLPEIYIKSKGTNALIISEKQGLLKQGSGINFVIVENKLKFEVNKLNIEKNNLKVNSQLIELSVK